MSRPGVQSGAAGIGAPTSTRMNATAARGDGELAEPLVGDGALRRHFNPSREMFWAKIAGLEQSLRIVHGARPELLAQCRRNLCCAKACIEKRWGHSHLAWRFLHRVDEDLLLVLPDDQVAARAIDVKNAFDLNITEPCVRAEWLGDGKGEGRLATAVLEVGAAHGADVSHVPERHVLREALHTVNDQVDRGFWALSMNVLTALWSGLLLAGLMVLLAVLWRWSMVPHLASASPPLSPREVLGDDPARDLLPIAMFGAMGTYLSNLLTKKDFLFVQGGPYLRYLLHPLLTMPILGAFSALIVYAIARSGILFSISGGPTQGQPAVGFQTPPGAVGYAYALIALVSGFAADKVLGATIGSVLRRLEQHAEKTVRPKGEGVSP